MLRRSPMFNAAMRAANRDGTKTQWRGPVTVPWHKGKRVKPYPPYYTDCDGVLMCSDEYGDWHKAIEWLTHPYGRPGDVWAMAEPLEEAMGLIYYADGGGLYLRPCDKGMLWQWERNKLSSAQMPIWAARMFKMIADVRIEHVQDISEADAIAEGMQAVGPAALTDRGSFIQCWDSIYGEKPGLDWASNPWAWVYSYRDATPDEVAEARRDER